MSEWTKTTIGEIAEIFDGPHATPAKTSSGPWFLSISSLDRGRLNLAESAHVSEEDFVKWTRRVTPVAGDLLFSYETRLGEAALMPDGVRACLGRRMGLLRPRTDRVDPRFLLYAYLGPQFQQTIAERSIHGATVDRIPLTELGKWPISIPQLNEQRAIAAVLGALDDKIAVNGRIIATSDELLASLAKGAFKNATRKVRLGELVTLKYGKSLRVGDRTPGPIPVFGGNGISGSHDTALVNGPGVIVGRKGANAGSVSWSSGDFWPIDTSFYVDVNSSNLPLEFVFFLLKKANLPELVGDSAIPGLNREIAMSVTVPLPDEGVIKGFVERARVNLAFQDRKRQEIQRLMEVRDVLLPKLMSGEVKVRDAENLAEGAV
ncbi:restriction endonuclease subunit S [Thermomonospora cellulosilytica]|uniref:Type I restriction enzyme S subunit n=1 Tax=Thermomonospora cellulosilytica TaxID=1411118 RepID=A0A7W3MVS4_9ACTN|nr:restriction endonuclease subunit S [Thermomonospora cellulosilytica]MBA9002817.1 type I restriction enzyme S subunit [Thermomonospora cellulosilytica]